MCINHTLISKHEWLRRAPEHFLEYRTQTDPFMKMNIRWEYVKEKIIHKIVKLSFHDKIRFLITNWNLDSIYIILLMSRCVHYHLNNEYTYLKFVTQEFMHDWSAEIKEFQYRITNINYSTLIENIFHIFALLLNYSIQLCRRKSDVFFHVKKLLHGEVA